MKRDVASCFLVSSASFFTYGSIILCLPSGFWQLFFDVVVIDFDAKNDAAADGGHEICDKQCPQDFRFVH